MNILSGEEMKIAEQKLLKVTAKKGFELKIPDERDYQNIGHFQTQLFPQATSKVQEEVQKMVTLTDNLKSRQLKDPNAFYNMVLYSIFSLLYEDTYRHQTDVDNSQYLLETIKCSLYSQDVDFTIIKGVNFKVDNQQMKALVARFFALMDKQGLRLINRLKCAEWICHHNPMLVNTFTLFFRFILIRLQIIGSSDFTKAGDVSDSIVNLIQYFDLSYRNFGQLFLFYDDGIFLALTDDSIVAGDYFQNQSEKHNEKQQLQIKSSVRMNMIESFLVNVDEKSSIISPNKKKNGIIDSDMKLFSSMLEVQKGGLTAKQKDRDLQTPTFNQEGQDIFHFGKKKKESIQNKEDMRQQFKRLIMDQEDSFVESQNDFNQAPTPFLGGQKQYSLASRFETKQPKPLVESPIDQLGNAVPFSSGFSSDNSKKSHNRHHTQLLTSFNNVFSPQSNDAHTGFSTVQTAHFYQSQIDGVLYSDQTVSLNQLQKCPCRNARKKRNQLITSVVDVSFVPTLKTSQFPRQPYKAGQYYKYNNDSYNHHQNEKDGTNYQRNQHKPAFLKTLKKNKEPKETIDIPKKFTKSTVGEISQRKQSTPNKYEDYQKIKQKTSAILSHEESPFHQSFSKSLPKENDSKNFKGINNIVKPLQRFDGSQTQFTAFGQPSYQSNYQKQPVIPKTQSEEPYLNKMPHNNIQAKNNSTTAKPNPPYKFYAPVQIIAPTVYLNSPKNHSNNIIVKVNDYNQRPKQVNPEVKNTQAQYSTNTKQSQGGLDLNKHISAIKSCSLIRPYQRHS